MAKPFRWYLPRGALAAALVTAGALACTDRGNPAGPGAEDGPPGASPSNTIPLAQLDCSASVTDHTVTCKPAGPPPTGVHADIIYGSQNVYVVSTTSSVNYDAGTHKFTFNLKIRNLLGQAIGTTNGIAADPAGVKVFFYQPPTATSGSGVITIDNADGVGAFTAAGQSYYQYVGLLDSFVESPNKLWQFDVPNTVGTFDFKLLLSSPVQFPTGWIDVSETTYSLSRTHTKTLFGVVRDQFGQTIPGAVITWGSSNSSLATIAADGTVTGLLPGTVGLTASSVNDLPGLPGAMQFGGSTFTITGTSLVWTAGAMTTDWNAPGNWDKGVSPVPLDSATVPVLASTTYPVLTGDQGIGRIEVADGANVNIGANTLTVSGDAVAGPGPTDGIVSTGIGRILLTGDATPPGSVQGLLPRMRVSASYTMTSNVNTTAPLRVESGRIRNQSFRLRVLNP